MRVAVCPVRIVVFIHLQFEPKSEFRNPQDYEAEQAPVFPKFPSLFSDRILSFGFLPFSSLWPLFSSQEGSTNPSQLGGRPLEFYNVFCLSNRFLFWHAPRPLCASNAGAEFETPHGTSACPSRPTNVRQNEADLCCFCVDENVLAPLSCQSPRPHATFLPELAAVLAKR